MEEIIKMKCITVTITALYEDDKPLTGASTVSPWWAMGCRNSSGYARRR
jgi:hypothetical protein